MLNQFKVRSRLIVLAALPLLVLVFLSLVSILNMRELATGVDSLYQDRVKPLQQIKMVSDSYAVTVVDTLHKHRADLFNATETSSQLRQATEVADDAWKAYRATKLTDSERGLADKAENWIGQWQQQIAEYQTAIDDGSILKIDNAVFNQKLYALADPLSQALDQLIQLQLEEAEQFTNHAQDTFASTMQMFILLVSLVVIALTILARLVYSSIQRPLSELRQIITLVGQKSDLRLRVKAVGQDEIAETAESFNQTIARVQQFFTELGSAVNMLAAASEEMSSISQQVSTTAFAQEQQANLIATAINQMSAAIQEVASSALATSERANQADEKTQSGYDKVTLNIQAIEQLSTAIKGASQVIEQLNGESEKISQVLAVIQSIAAQTNLLALNAAIEAARAGEAGRGFAVVADEVRTLATNTQKATESIRTMIENLQSAAKEAVMAMAQSQTHADSSVHNAQQAGEVLGEIRSSVGTIVDMNVQISAATEEQTIVAEDINKNISEFSISIGEVTRSAQHSAEASGSLAELAAKLRTQASAYQV
jgi:methyl-accepting chemotaxis protein